MALSDIFTRNRKPQIVTVEVEYITVGDIVVLTVPSGKQYRGIICEVREADQLAKVGYLQGDTMMFSWEPADSLVKVG